MSSTNGHAAKHDAVDISHHFSAFARRLDDFRLASTVNFPAGAINLNKAIPDAEYCPITAIDIHHLDPDAFALQPTDAFPAAAQDREFCISREFNEEGDGKFALKTALSYGAITGIPPLGTWITEWVEKIHNPLYNDWKTLINCGSAGSWTTCLSIFLDPGEMFLTDMYAYNIVLTQARALDHEPVPILTDGEGMSADDLERVLKDWDSGEGKKRPRLIYTQGCITNPTGQLTSVARKKAIYELAVKFDLIILEDDPYYFQQAAPYPCSKEPQTQNQTQTQTDDEWLRSLVPSYLSMDYQGRVVRLDTFSKSLAPGGRLGYYTAPASVIDKLIAHGDIHASFPSGFAQAILGELLHKYQHVGFVRWLRGICAQYEMRRNWVIETLDKALDLEFSPDGRMVTAYARNADDASKTTNRVSLMSFRVPAGGMCMWFNVHLSNHPRFPSLAAASTAQAKNQLTTDLVASLAKAGVMVRRGDLSAAASAEERAERGEKGAFLRTSFGWGAKEEMEKGYSIFAAELGRLFGA
ncbi:Aminotran-1-2 domain-containing protein [Favolaschia claudopus]|uniref:Aminotran-1-2 domain-containing protein n=1 Tax=Favolaschia claudopus TaxID=2862362 RepID=A0AAW0D319_9AGAR